MESSSWWFASGGSPSTSGTRTSRSTPLRGDSPWSWLVVVTTDTRVLWYRRRPRVRDTWLHRARLTCHTAPRASGRCGCTPRREPCAPAPAGPLTGSIAPCDQRQASRRIVASGKPLADCLSESASRSGTPFVPNGLHPWRLPGGPHPPRGRHDHMSSTPTHVPATPPSTSGTPSGTERRHFFWLWRRCHVRPRSLWAVRRIGSARWMIEHGFNADADVAALLETGRT